MKPLTGERLLKALQKMPPADLKKQVWVEFVNDRGDGAFIDSRLMVAVRLSADGTITIYEEYP